MKKGHSIKIVVDEKIPFLEGVFEPYAKVEYYPGKEISNKIIKDADALIIRTRTMCNESLLINTNVQAIATATIGFDHIDIDYCRDKNIKWFSAPGCNSTSVMQYVVSALLSIAEKRNLSLKEMTIGIVGVGNVGTKVAKAAKVLGMNVLLNDPPRKRKEGDDDFCDLDVIARESDIISFHVPLNKTGIDKTYHLVDEDFLKTLKKKPILINTSRGEILETVSIKKTLKSKMISAAILDVWENEPEVDLELLNLVDIATSHIAGYSLDGKANGTIASVNTIADYFNMEELKDWSVKSLDPGNIPTTIKIDCLKLSWQSVIYKVVTSVYSVSQDDQRFRNNVEAFEYQRENYPVRKEFSNYTVVLKNGNKKIIDMIISLGFKSVEVI